MSKDNHDKRFSYSEISNIVVQQERSGPRDTIPSTDGVSLTGRITGVMGDRANVVESKELERLKESMGKRSRKDAGFETERRAKRPHTLVVSGESALNFKQNYIYYPTNDNTSSSFSRLLKMISAILSEEPDALRSAADDIIVAFKTPLEQFAEGEATRREHVADALSIPQVPQEIYSEFEQICVKELTDFRTREQRLHDLQEDMDAAEALGEVGMMLLEEGEESSEGQDGIISDEEIISEDEEELNEDREILKGELDEKQMKKTYGDEKTKDGVDYIDVNVESGLEDKHPGDLIDFEFLGSNLQVKILSQLQTKDVTIGLPSETTRIERKAYDAVLVPAKPRASFDSDSLIATSKLPAWTRMAWNANNIRTLNPIQSTVLPIAFGKYTENMLVCAPTGAGKTNVALLCMLNVIGQYINHFDEVSGNIDIDLDSFKIVYISPMKALVAEQVMTFSKLLKSFGITVAEMTGDISLSGEALKNTQVIISTPEKWDVISRKSSERSFTESVKLVIFDEIHLLHDSRGPVIEALVARIKRQERIYNKKTRMIGLSATLPNYRDVAEFLSVHPERGLFYFGAEYRPVPLEQVFIGVKTIKATKRMQTMNEIVFENCIESAAGNQQVLVFVHSRKDTVKTAKAVKDLAMTHDSLAQILSSDSGSRVILEEEAQRTSNPALKELLRFGFAVHHAGMSREDRQLVEALFADRHVKVLVSTSTLAWGVNLPAHTVIIKGTQVYNPEKSSWVELSHMDLFQMIGRAGRPGFDTSGKGIIITNHADLNYYLSLNTTQLPIESQMLNQLADFINAEIAYGGLASRSEVADWLNDCYLNIRLTKNPDLYGFSQTMVENDSALRQLRVDLVHSPLLLLNKFNLINYNKSTGTVYSTALGRIAAGYYLKYATIATFNDNLRSQLQDLEIVKIFSLANEFKLVPVRPEEKIELARLVERVPLPIKGSSDDSSAKVSVLLQAFISRLRLDGFALMSDMIYITQSANRLFRSLFEIAVKKQWAAIANQTLTFCKAVEQRQWTSCTPLRQFKSAPEDILRRLEKRDISFDKLLLLSPSELGELVRMPKQGRLLHDLLSKFPRIKAEAFVKPMSRTLLAIEMEVAVHFKWDAEIHGKYGLLFHVFVEDGDQEIILHKDTLLVKPHHTAEDASSITLNMMVPLTDPLHSAYYIRIVSDTWLGVEYLVPIAMKSLLLPSKPTSFTPLSDMERIPVSAIKWHDIESTFSKILLSTKFSTLQSQIFPAAFESDDSLLICSQNRTGKSTILLLALIRFLKMKLQISSSHTDYDNNNNTIHSGTALLLSSVPAAAHSLFERVSSLVSPLVESKKISLPLLITSTSDIPAILKQMSSTSIVVADAISWEIISRKWRKRAAVKNVSLALIQGLEILERANSLYSASMETAISRLRFAAAQLKQPLRIVATAASISNAIDVAEWLGIKMSSSIPRLFSFSPSIRNSPLDINIRSFDQLSRASRLAAMTRSVFDASREGIQSLIVVSDRAVGRDLTRDLVSLASSRKTDNKFLSCHPHAKESIKLAYEKYATRAAILSKQSILNELHTTLQKKYFGSDENVVDQIPSAGKNLLIREKTLAESIERGIGYVHEGFSKQEKEWIEQLFRDGALGCLVVPQSMISRSNTQQQHSATTQLSDSITAPHVFVVETSFLSLSTGAEETYHLRETMLPIISRACISSFSFQQEILNIRSVTRAEVFVLTSSSYSNFWKSSLLNQSSQRAVQDSNSNAQSAPEATSFGVDSSPALESSLEDFLPEVLNAEISVKTISSLSEALDWLTWTYLYRRIPKNPNFYGLAAVTHIAFSEHLSGMIETAVETLENTACISVSSAVDGDDKNPNVSVLNMGLIAAHYGISISTIHLLANTEESALCKRRSLVSILASTDEVFRSLTLRTGEEMALKKLARILGPDAPESYQSSGSSFATWKSICLIQAFLHRVALPADWKNDLIIILPVVLQLIVALVDILSSKTYWKASRSCMDLHQFLCTATTPSSSNLMQAPHINEELAELLTKLGASDVTSILDLDDDVRDSALSSLPSRKLEQLANFCNFFPSITISAVCVVSKDSNGKEMSRVVISKGKKQEEAVKMYQGGDVVFDIIFDRDEDSVNIEHNDFDKGFVSCMRPYFPSIDFDENSIPQFEENWWICVRVGENNLSAISRTQIKAGRATVSLSFEVEKTTIENNGKDILELNIVCDSFRGADQSLKIAAMYCEE